MSVKPRLFAAAATLVALGVGAAPSFAAARSPLALQVEESQPATQQYVGRTHTAAQQRKTMAALLANAKQCDQAARLVAHAQGTPIQREGQHTWVNGVRLQASGDRQYAYGVRMLLAGRAAAGKQRINAAGNTLEQANTVVVRADKQLGVYRAVAKIENG